MEKLYDREQLSRRLGIVFDKSIAEQSGESVFLESLQTYFLNCEYPDPSDYSFAHCQYQEVFDLNYQAASELFSLLGSDEAAISFAISTFPEASSSNSKSISVTVNFWTEVFVRYFPEERAARGFSSIYHSIFKNGNAWLIFDLTNEMVQTLRGELETLEVVSHFINNFECLKTPENGYWPTLSVSGYLYDLYRQGNRDIKPLILKYWRDMYFLGGSYDRIWKLCHEEMDLSTIGQSLFSQLHSGSALNDLTINMFDCHMDQYPALASAETLTEFCKSSDKYLWQRGYFWLSERYKKDPATFDLLIKTIEESDNLKKRQYALRLVFFHYHNAPKAAKSIVDAAKMNEENFEEFKKLMTSDDEDSIAPERTTGQAREIAGRGNFIIRARIFAKLCKQQKIKTGVKIPRSLKRSLLEQINNIIATDMKQSTILRLAYRSMSVGEKAFLNKVGDYQEFYAGYKKQLEAIPSSNSVATKALMEEVMQDALTQFGLIGIAAGAIRIAENHLQKEDISPAATEIRELNNLHRKFGWLSYDYVSNDLALKREYSLNARLYAELEERAFFLITEGKEKDLKPAFERAIDDYWKQK